MARQIEEYGQGDRHDHRDEDPWHLGRQALEAEDDRQAEEPDAERPWVRLVQVLKEGDELVDEAAGVDLEPEQLRQLADEDHDREPGQVADADGSGQKIGNEPELGDPGGDRDCPHEERKHAGQGDRRLLVASRQWEDRRRDHRPEGRIGTEDEDRRRPDQGVRDEADYRRVQPGDRRQPGQLRVGHALRDEQGHQDDAGDQVARQP